MELVRNPNSCSQNAKIEYISRELRGTLSTNVEQAKSAGKHKRAKDF